MQVLWCSFVQPRTILSHPDSLVSQILVPSINVESVPEVHQNQLSQPSDTAL